MEETTEETKMTYEEGVAAARARMDAYASQPEDDRSERWADYAAVRDDPSVSDEDKFAAMQSAIRSNRRAAGFSS